MKKFIKEYLNVFAYTAIGFVLIISGFYLFMNYYHSEEIKSRIYIGQNDVNYQNYISKLDSIKNNLKEFNSKKKSNSDYKTMYNKLSTCYTILSAEGTLATISADNYFNSYDIYKIGARFQSDALNICWAMHLSYLTSDKVSGEFKLIAPYVENAVELITSQTNFALKELQNNSSYFYSTNITASTIRNYLSSDYQIIAKSYIEFADIILNLSTKINEDKNTYESGGNLND